MSGVAYYRSLLAQRERIEAFRRAIHRTVRPGDRVLDVGTGLGTYALFAAEAGAGKVWAVDGQPILHVAKAIAQRNDVGDRVEFVRGWLPGVELGERVDVIIFEDFSARFLDRWVFTLLRDVWRKHAAPGARFVPASGEPWVAPVTGERLTRTVASLGQEEHAYGIDWTASRSYAANLPRAIEVLPDDVLAPPAPLGRIELTELGSGVPPAPEVEWVLPEAATVTGLVYGFNMDLGAGECLSNTPGSDPGSWGQLFLPLDPPLTVRPGGVIRARVSNGPGDGGAPTWLSWWAAADGHTVRGNEFAAHPASLSDIASTSPDGVPALNRDGHMATDVLRLTDGVRSLTKIADELRRLYPEVELADAMWTVQNVLRHRVTAKVWESATVQSE